MDNHQVASVVQEWFRAHHQTLALAESCTGGALASVLTAIPSASEYFLGSFVTYSNAMKQEILGVSKEILSVKGAVSPECVRAMLLGVFAHTSADYAIAVSGIAGPAGGTSERPVGTIWAAIGKRGKPPEVGTFYVPGARAAVIAQTTNHLLNSLHRMAVLGLPAFP